MEIAFLSISIIAVFAVAEIVHTTTNKKKMKTNLKPTCSCSHMATEAIRLWGNRTLERAHRDIISTTPRTQEERKKVCAVLEEVRRRGAARG